MRVGFLFNHDQLHQVAHGLPIAIELMRRGTIGEVVILTGSPSLTHEVQRLLRKSDIAIPCRELRLRSKSMRLLARACDRLLPVTRLALYRDNLDVFRSLDILVVAEKTSLVLKSLYGLRDLRIVHTRHGAGDRAIGFNRASGNFDHVLVAGDTIRQRLMREAGVAHDRISTVGYPKFDLLTGETPRLPFQANGRPTVLYNPHVAPHLSSWYRHGIAVLEYFARSERYNLIFAPHVMLFRRPAAITVDPLRLRLSRKIPRRFHAAANIHIDLASPACTDMTYTRAADFYLGDASSQVYEFLFKPRPCIFLNSHGAKYANDPNFAHWGAGQVIDDVAGLDSALRDAVQDPQRYRFRQQELFDSHIDLTVEPSAARAARALEVFAATPADVISGRPHQRARGQTELGSAAAGPWPA